MKRDDVKPPERQTQTDDLACGKLINCNAKRERDGIRHKERARISKQKNKGAALLPGSQHSERARFAEKN